MIRAITLFETKDTASAGQFGKIFSELKTLTPKETGCLSYDVYQVEKNPLRYYVIETWETELDLENHAKGVVDRGLVEQVQPLLSGRINTEILNNF